MIQVTAPSFTTLTRIVILTGVYFASGWVAKQATFMSGEVALVYPSSGIALAAILILGFRGWPGVALGAFVYALATASGNAADSFGAKTVADVLGNTVGALTCAHLLQRMISFRNPMERVKDVAGFVTLACLLGTTVNAAFKVVGLLYVGELDRDQMLDSLVTWWVPNAMACLIITPFVLSWGSQSVLTWNTRKIFEASACVIGLVGGTLISFNSWYTYGIQNYPFAYLPYPFLVWGALRFGQRGATTGTLLVAILAITALLDGRGPFVTPNERDSLVIIGSYLGIISVANLLLAAASTERTVAEEAARRSQAMFLLISENVSDMIAVTDGDGKRLYNSPYYARLLGEKNLNVGSDAFAQIHPEDKALVKAVFDETVQTGVGKRIEYRFLLPDGSVHYIESVGNYVPGDHGESGKLVSIGRDITERKHDEEQLRLLASAVRFADDSIMITSAEVGDDGPQIVFVNPAFTRMTGWSAEEAIGRPASILNGAKTDATEIANQRQGMREGRVVHGETVNYRKDGSEFQNEWHIEPIKNDQGEITHFLAIQRDITQRKLIQQELATARDDALAAARLKAEFLANMSHEIRTPMNGVIGMTNLMLKTALTPQQKDFAQTIRGSADTLLTIINDILDFSKIEAGKLKFENVAFDLTEALDQITDLLGAAANTKGLDLVCVADKEVPTRLRGDVVRIKQVLTNLVGNAIKFTDKGEVMLQVSLKEENDSECKLSFEVRDSGIGIPPEAQARLFQAFSQADGSTSRKYGGTGLGLAISKQLVGLMNGQIGVRSEPGVGSTFWFTAVVEKQSEPATKETELEPSLNGARILVVDDNASTRNAIISTLEVGGAACTPAEDSLTAIRKLREATAASRQYELVLIDLHLPDLDGLTLLDAARGMRDSGSVRYVLMGPLSELPARTEWDSLSIRGCIPKPIHFSDMLELVADIFKGKNADAVSFGTRQAHDPSALPTSTPVLKANKRLLLAEDNPINQKVAVGQFAEFGITLEIVGNGVQAVEAVKNGNFEAVFMDCQMPVMDGFQATEAIREWEFRTNQTRHIRIIAMTANAMEGDRERCIAAGMDDYLSKPVEQESLQVVLHRMGILAPPPEAAAPTAPALPAVSDEEAPVNLKRLHRAACNDPKLLREILAMFIPETETAIIELEAALKANDAANLERVAHKLAGSSGTLGMNAMVTPLRALEGMGRKREISEAAPQFDETKKQFKRIQDFLSTYSIV